MSNDTGTKCLPADAELSKKESLRILGLAIELGDNDGRMDELLTDFVDGFATGWRMAVGTCFRDSLDIKQTVKKGADREKGLLWTQGGIFSFSQGDTLYDTPHAYERWGTALQHIDTAYQVLAGTPSRPKRELVTFRRDTTFTGSLRGNRPRADVARRKAVLAAIPSDWVDSETISSAVKQATGKGVSVDLLCLLTNLGALKRRVETVASRFSGTVEFQVMVPNADRSKLCVTDRIRMSQDAFVALLIT